MSINIYECGLCKKNPYRGIRKGMREHLRKEHLKKRKLANFEDSKGRTTHQPWWKVMEFK
ncbi:hypothetical protein LCGC14_2554050 [marine sediment metagenome]|uniref:Uncharacterized protein n=1 Tax=marine sediment metagenome TaxID=412755 RepID=A0A0F9ALY5_9ZZZZ